MVRDEQLAVGHEVVLAELCLEVLFGDVVGVERDSDLFFDELLDLLERHFDVLEGLDGRLAAEVEIKLRTGLSDDSSVDVCEDVFFLLQRSLQARTGRGLLAGRS